MRKQEFWRAGWFLGALVALAVLLVSRTPFMQAVEAKAYGLAQHATGHEPLDRLAIIAIDEASIASLGPALRAQHARLIDLLAAADVRLVVNTLDFSAAQQDPGYLYIARLTGLYQQLLAQAGGESAALAAMGQALRDAEYALNADRQLAQSFGRSGRVILPMLVRPGEAGADGASGNAAGPPLPAFSVRHRLEAVSGKGAAPAVGALVLPIDVIGQTAAAMGHFTTADAEREALGGVRAEPLAVRHGSHYYPSLSLATAAAALDLTPADVHVDLGHEVRLGALHVPVDRATRMHPFIYRGPGGAAPFSIDAFHDVVSGRVPAERFRGKIVLVGTAATGSGMAPVEALAHSVSSILGGHAVAVPAWGIWAELAVYLLVAAYLIVLLPRLSAGGGAMLSAGLLAVLIGAHFSLLAGGGIWLQLMISVVLLLVGHLLLMARRMLEAGQGAGQRATRIEAPVRTPPESRSRPAGPAMPAPRVNEGVATAAPLAAVAAPAPAAANDAASPAAGQLSALGRYQIDKPLGKGAMGIVYQGRDPNINRVVAIKTLALSQEFAADDLADVRARFFREAETAGRLNHPNIVTIFDAGEAQGLAYIAMEFLRGRDLVPHTRPDALLPLARVVTIVARVADALHYAHAHNVVHRDIKPANIMYEPGADQVKVTDFGIARITDISRTRTGMVLGTPAYMSPEQLTGQKIDGRSDLYSLGVTLFQLCCGRQPFVADSMARLMAQIANEPAPDIRTLNPQVPPMLAAVIAKSLAKPVGQRFQTGAEMAAALRYCLARPSSAAKSSEGRT